MVLPMQVLRVSAVCESSVEAIKKGDVVMTTAEEEGEEFQWRRGWGRWPEAGWGCRGQEIRKRNLLVCSATIRIVVFDRVFEMGRNLQHEPKIRISARGSRSRVFIFKRRGEMDL